MKRARQRPAVAAQASPASARPSRQLIDDVKSRTDLVAVVGRDIDLSRRGNQWVGRSPRHPDTSPSFVVWPESQRWRDYAGGGDSGGDVFDYLKYVRGTDFSDALRDLAGAAGVTLDDASAADVARAAERGRLEEVLTEAARFYHRHLSRVRRDALQRERGFTDETIDDARLGFGAPGLWDHLGRWGATEEERLATGLFVRFRNGRTEEFFRNRLIFPYWRSGRVVYLAGRRTDASTNAHWDEAKYKKLPTRSSSRPYVSPLVTNDFFFGEDDASTSGLLLVTEGIADALAARQAGFKCISPGSVRFRAQDRDKLLRLTARAERVVIVNDSEESGAGDQGAVATATVLWDAGRDVRLATIPRAEGAAKVDVNDLVRSQGAEALRRVVEEAKPLPHFLVERIPQSVDASGLHRALEPVAAALRSCPALVRDEVAALVAIRFSLDRHSVAREFRDIAGDGPTDRGLGASAPTGGKPAFFVHDRQRSDLIAEVRTVVVAENDRRIADAAGGAPVDLPLLFRRSNAIVGLRGGRDGGEPTLRTLTAVEMDGLLTRFADWFDRSDIREGASRRPAVPPRGLSQDLLAFPPDGLPTVDSVASTPVFARDGRLLATPGLHASDALWLALPPSLAGLRVPERPSREEIDAARALLFDDLLVDFPFVDPSDRAHMVGALLLPFARELIDGCTPLHVVEAPTPGSGKGLLVSLLGVIATGKVCGCCTLPGAEEEVRKKLTAELSLGRRLIVLDNLPEGRPTASASLASALTSETWTDRVLGASEMRTVPVRAVWVCTANNPRFSRELIRRCVRIRIDPKRDTPWGRSGFRHDPIVDWARDNRPRLVGAILTLIRAWVGAGMPAGNSRLGGFERWARVIGGVLANAGIDGFLTSTESFHAEADADRDDWRAFTRAWWEEHRSSPVRVTGLNALCERLDLLESQRGGGTERSQQTKLGNLLHANRDSIFGPLRIELVRDAGHKGKLYALSPAPDESTSDKRNGGE